MQGGVELYPFLCYDLTSADSSAGPEGKQDEVCKGSKKILGICQAVS